MVSRFENFGLAVILCLFLSGFVADGSSTRPRHSIKTIKTEDGTVYDCVDFYKQPSFDHPLLKNHSYHPEMRPSIWPQKIGDNTRSSTVVEAAVDFKLKGGGCPRGTVPIRRLSNDEKLLRKKLHRKYYSQLQLGEVDPNHSPNSPYNTYFAIAQSKRSIPRAYYGMAANISVWNPKVQSSQYSSSEIIIRGGRDAIFTGWTVNPGVYKDNQTRFFIYTVAKGMHCFDSECGFISIRPDIPLNFVIKPISVIEGPSYVFRFMVFKDPEGGNWWLAAGPNDTVLGFWDQNIFGGLHQSGDYVACGGEVSGPSDLGLPEMGTGYRIFISWRESNAYCEDFRVVNEAYKFVYQDKDLESYSNHRKYDVGKAPMERHLYIYGGPKNYG